jgi:L-amino acid N-acyltransferase YncA
MTSGDVVIRPLLADDWEHVFQIFRAVVAEGETYAYPDGLSSEAARALWVEGPPAQAVVALRDGVILGTAKFGPNRPARGSHVATASFMVASDARGSGVGRAMCEYVIAAAKERGYAAMQFNAVVTTNVHAIELYRQLGFVTIGTVPQAFDHATRGRVGLEIMYLQL